MYEEPYRWVEAVGNRRQYLDGWSGHGRVRRGGRRDLIRLPGFGRSGFAPERLADVTRDPTGLGGHHVHVVADHVRR